jgi:hypothetical protein
MIIAIIILSLLLATSLYVVRNLLLKNEKAEDLIITYEDYINNLRKSIGSADAKLQEIDEKGLFDSDDEIGWFFKHVKTIQDSLNQFNPKI